MTPQVAASRSASLVANTVRTRRTNHPALTATAQRIQSLRVVIGEDPGTPTGSPRGFVSHGSLSVGGESRAGHDEVPLLIGQFRRDRRDDVKPLEIGRRESGNGPIAAVHAAIRPERVDGLFDPGPE